MVARRFGRYRLDGLIGRGSVGEVWRAHDDDTGRTVALKILSITAAEDPDYRRRFEREARIGAGLDDPHIVPIHGFGEQDGRLFLAMAYIPGLDVAGRLRGGPMGAPAAVDLISQIAEALDAAHAAGLIHRDVKPANIIVHASGFAYLIDFGIARASNQTTITATGFTVGTLAYMAPERFAGHADSRSDVYALACVLYECLTANRPFGDTDPVQQLHAHLWVDPPRATAVDPEVPEALDEVIARGMAKEADDRYQSAGELAAAARAAIGMAQPVSRTPPLLESPQPAGAIRSRTIVESPPPRPRPTRALPMPGHGAPAAGPTRTSTPVRGASAAGPTRAQHAPAPRPTRVMSTPEPRRDAAPATAAPQRFPIARVAAIVAAAVVLLGVIAFGTALLPRGGGTRPTTTHVPPAVVGPTTEEPPETTAPTTLPRLTIPVPPGFGTPPFQIPGIPGITKKGESERKGENEEPGEHRGHHRGDDE
ncbi:protein kinase [Nocardia sp. NPDC051570]|uniref:serine/threonine-protein kinase n=1 Tax=Nocardia sp. NPDC051570 TaxID=3364324 RepID=UPI003790044E